MNKINTKKKLIRSRLQYITNEFEDFAYDIETKDDEWLIFFRKENENENEDEIIKFIIEILLLDETSNKAKFWENNKWDIYKENNIYDLITKLKTKLDEKIQI